MSSESKSNAFTKLAEEWIELNEEIKTLTNRRDRLKKKVDEVMERHSRTQIKGLDFLITRREISRRTVSIKDLPREAVEKYARHHTYTTVSITSLRSSVNESENEKSEE
jgi:hypothetical protein